MPEVNDDWRAQPQRGFFLGKREDAFAGLPTCVEVDVIGYEEITAEAQVTENPVEAGAPVADHIIDKPDVLELNVVVSDVPMAFKNGELPSNDPFTSIVSRSATGYQFFKDLMRAKVPFDYQSGFELHTNMVLERVTARKDAASAGWFDGRLTLRQIRIVTTETVTYPPRKAGKAHRQASKTVNAGEKKTEPVKEEQKARSILKQMVDSFKSDPAKGLAALGF